MIALTLALALAQFPDAAPQDDVGQPPLKLTPRPAVSAAGISAERLRELMHTYVRGEKRAGVPFAIAGVAQTLSGALLLTSSSRVATGAAWPLLVFGVVDLAASLVFGLRSQGPGLDALLDESVPRFLEHERKHARRITHVYQPLLLAVEGAVLLTGGILAGAGAGSHNDAVAGVGFGLAVGALALFLLDWAVLDRAQAYETALGVPPAGTL